MQHQHLTFPQPTTLAEAERTFGSGFLLSVVEATIERAQPRISLRVLSEVEALRSLAARPKQTEWTTFLAEYRAMLVQQQLVRYYRALLAPHLAAFVKFQEQTYGYVWLTDLDHWAESVAQYYRKAVPTHFICLVCGLFNCREALPHQRRYI